MLKKLLAAAAIVAAMLSFARAQTQFQPGQVQGNPTALAGQGRPAAVTAILDQALGSTRGAILERGAAGWAIVGPGSTSGLSWVSNGPGADPAYQVLGIVGGGTNCGVASGACLDNITGFAGTGLMRRTGASAYTFGVTASIGEGGTGQTTAPAALSALMPTPTRTGDIIYWSGSNWVAVAGNNSGTQCLQESNVGIPSWASCASSGVTSLNGQTGALIAYFQPQGRLTLTSGVAVMTSSVSAANTVYYTPYAGDLIPLYNGTSMVPTQFTEVSQLTTDTTKSPAAVAANSCYDDFAWNDSGTFRVTRGPAWTSITSRGTGAGTSELQLQNGIYLNKQAITNGPAALRGTFVGSICSNGSLLIDFNFGAISSGATPAVLNVWNAYNRVDVDALVGDSTTNWTYTTTTLTWRQANNNANAKATFLRGLSEDTIEATYFGQTSSVSGTTNCALGVGLDSVTVVSGNPLYAQTTTSPVPIIASYTGAPSLGQHYVAMLELIIASAGCTIYGSSGVAYSQTGLRLKLRM
jgi:hypothetical protein